MWYVLLGALALVTAAGFVYLVTRVRKFAFAVRIAEKSKALSFAAAIAATCLPALFFIVNVYAVVIVYVHVVLIWLLCELCAGIYRKAKKIERRRYIAGVCAVAISVLYLGAGWFFAHHVFRVDYGFSTAKELPGGKLRIVEIADLHLGITLDGEDFARQIERINDVEPDIVVICGDYVDDDTEKADTLVACDALGGLKTEYGVYFIFGNHDEGYFNYRDFSTSELCEALEKNGVVILRDETALIADSFYVVGRRDRSMPGRKEACELTEPLDKSKYIVMLDHQPNDYANETLSEADLVLSGHTHGGHIFPAGAVGLWMGANDRVYGVETRDSGSGSTTTFLVSSGISGWGIPFKTGAISEFVVIDVKQE